MLKYQDENGNEIDVYTKEEVEAQVQTKLEDSIKAKDQEIETLKKIASEKTENFQKYNEMTEEQKKAYDANTVELLKRIDKEREGREEMEKKLTSYQTSQQNSVKEGILYGLHGGNKDVEALIKEKYAIINLPDTTPQEIEVRAREAAKLAGISLTNPNPIYRGFSGEAPKHDDNKEFIETEKGKTMMDEVRKNLNIKST